MSALKYYDEEGGTIEGQNAQNFLQNNLNKGESGRYTQDQIDKLMQSGGPAVVNANDGVIGEGPAYDAQNPTKNKGDAGGASGGGKLSAEEIREKFGLTYNEEHASGSKTHANGSNEQTNAIYQRDTGEYIGTMTGGIESYQSLNDYALEHGTDGSGVKWAGVNQWNGVNDVASAASSILGEKKEEGGEEEKPNAAIEHSPEIKQAIERVRTYENDVFSGKTSDDIFGGGAVSNNYSFDHNKGSSGIGTRGGVAADNSSAKASANFLDAKKTDVKKAYNFTPAN